MQKLDAYLWKQSLFTKKMIAYRPTTSYAAML